MVTLVAGAVAVGIVSVCAIPFGCFISRKLAKAKVLVQQEAQDELQDVEGEGRNPDSAEIVLDEAEYQIEEIWSRTCDGRRVPRVQIRVLLTSGSSRSIDPRDQGYVAASGGTSGDSAQATEAGGLSMQNLASAGPATERENEGVSSSLPAAARVCRSVDEGLENSDTTCRFEITMSGPFSRSFSRFGEFKTDVRKSSTPKSRRKTNCAEGNGDRSDADINGSSFWRRASFIRNCNGPAKGFKPTRDVEEVGVEVIPGEDSRRGPKFEEVRNCSGYEDRKSRTKTAGPLPEGEKSCRRGRWGFPGRFFETFRETSFATL